MFQFKCNLKSRESLRRDRLLQGCCFSLSICRTSNYHRFSQVADMESGHLPRHCKTMFAGALHNAALPCLLAATFRRCFQTLSSQPDQVFSNTLLNCHLAKHALTIRDRLRIHQGVHFRLLSYPACILNLLLSITRAAECLLF